jgi:hypothetical protein
MNDLLRDRVLRELQGGLWHTTLPDRFKAILEHGAILPEPNIPDCERWATTAGAKHYHYVRTLEGICLFDFDQFEPETYSERYPASSWSYFVPCHLAWGRAVWIELDRSKLTSPHFVSGSELVAKWKADEAYGHNFMPEIEAAYLGPIPRMTFKRALLVQRENPEFSQLTF